MELVIGSTMVWRLEASMETSINPVFLDLLFKARSDTPVGPSEIIGTLLKMPRWERLPHALSFHGQFAPEDARFLLADAYSDAELASHLGVDRLTVAFRTAGFATETPGLTPPDSPLRVFRGTGSSRR
jgi:hypothetical protein